MPNDRSHVATTKEATGHTKIARAINRVARAIRRDVRRRTTPDANFDFDSVLCELEAATKSIEGAAEPPEVKRAVKGLIAAARMLGEAL